MVFSKKGGMRNLAVLAALVGSTLARERLREAASVGGRVCS
jgi:hypothetical protein